MKSAARALARSSLVLIAVAAARADSDPRPGDAVRGKALFQQSCALCHSAVAGPGGQIASGQGPSLVGVVGRRAGSVDNFNYSKPMAASGITWDAATLERFLAAPSAMVPNTTMPIITAERNDRADLVAFLSTLAWVPPVPGEQAAAPPESSGDPGDWHHAAPGMRHAIAVADLPAPFATVSSGNGPKVVSKPADAVLSVPPGFAVKVFATDLTGPRLLRVAPNGDIFVAETRAGRIHVLRAADGADSPSVDEVFASGLDGPFGIAFYPNDGNPKWLYVANNNSLVRFPYRVGDTRARGEAQTVVPRLCFSSGGHSTRDVAFSNDGARMFISVGSGSNVAEGMVTKNPAEVREWEAAHGMGAAWGPEENRADILVTDPEGRRPLHAFATGIRNGVGLAVDPATGDLWTSTNERDALGDDLVPDYLTRVGEGKFYGWPWYYMGSHEDPRHAGERPDLAGKVTVPDVPVQSHSASLEMVFYTATAGPSAFPSRYRGDIFAAFHGSWNRSNRTGYKVVRVLRKDGVPTGEYEDFLTGFVVDGSSVWGRPVGVAVAHDGALLVTEDGNDTVLRISTSGDTAGR
jgi:glucose/arabinose dehydrogenase/cytochrome c2